ncbi:MAG: hypothetical protein AABX69_00505 [Nanoarchaeota archaeon]
MQQRMDLFGKDLPKVVQHRYNYGLQLYYMGQIMAGQTRYSEADAEDGLDLEVNLEEARVAVGLGEMVYHGIHNLDISPEIHVPHEMLLAMNPSQIFELYAGTWLLKLDTAKWGKAVNRQKFWQVVGAARRIISEKPMNSYLLRRLDELCGKTYIAGEDGSLPARLQQLPQYVADRFMESFTSPFLAPNENAGYVPVSRLKVVRNVTLDQAFFGHFEQKFAEGERQLSITAQQSR